MSDRKIRRDRQEPPALVGRAREMATLDAWLADTRGGRGGLGLVSGAAGTGKTTLLRAFVERAAAQEVRIAWGRVENGTRSHLPWPWPTILRRLREPRCAELAAQWSQATSGLSGTTSGEGPQIREQNGGDRICNQLLATLPAAVENTPTVIVIDDIHWMDMASVALLRILVEHTEDLPLLLLAATRPEDEETAAAETSPQRELAFAADSRNLVLPPLDSEAIGELLGPGLTDQLGGADAAVRLVDGLPLLAVELRATAQWPAQRPENELNTKLGLTSLAHKHLMGLDEAGRDLVDAAAVYRKSLDAGLLGAILETDPVKVERLVYEGRDAGFLTGYTESEHGVFRFAHDLLAEAVEAELDPNKRRDLHARFARELVRRSQHSGGIDVAEIAYHACQGVPIIAAAEAAHCAQRAAAEANETGSHSAAAAWVRDGLNALDLCPSPNTTLIRAELVIEEFSARLGEDTPTSIQQIKELARLLSTTTVAERSSLIGKALAQSDWPGADPAVLRALAELVETSLHDHPKPCQERTLLLATKSFLFTRFSGVDACQTAAAAAREAFADAERDKASPTGRAFAILARLIADLEDPDLEERRALAEEFENSSDHSIPQVIRDLAESIQVGECFMRGDLAAATTLIERIERRIEDDPAAAGRWYPHHLRAMRASMIVDTDTARQALSESLANTTASDYVYAYVAALTISAHLHEVTATPLEIEGLVEPSKAARRRVSSKTIPALDSGIDARAGAWHASILKWGVLNGMKERSRAALDQMATTEFQEFPRNAAWLSTICMLAETATLLEHRSSASMLLQLLAPYEKHFNIVATAICPGGLVAGYMAPLAALCGDLEYADKLATQAIEENDRIGLVVFATVARLENARILQARNAPGDENRVETLTQEVRTAIERYELDGLAPLLAEVESGTKQTESGVAAPGPGIPGKPPEAGLWEDGDTWVLCWAGQYARLKDQRGFVVLRELVRHPGAVLHARELMNLGASAHGTSAAGARGLRSGEMQVADDDGLEIADDAALRSYRSRLEELGAELAEADDHADLGRAESLRAEQESILEMLRSATGAGGRRRKVSSDAERARTAIRKRIKAALDRIKDELPALYDHLDAHLTTGARCAYEPDPVPNWVTERPGANPGEGRNL